MKLELKEVERLLGEPDAQSRVQVASSISTALADPELSEHEQDLALDIVGVLIRDVEVSVRAAVSEGLQNSSLLPRARAMFLAKDVEWVALPILRASPVLEDEDLVEIIGAGSQEKQVAIAGRVSVSAMVCDALVDTGVEEVAKTLLDNPGSDISDEALHRVLDMFRNSTEIQESLVERARLPLTVIADLIGNVTEVLRKRQVEHHKLPAVLVEALLQVSGEEILAKAVHGENRGDQVELLAEKLEKAGSLSFSLLLRTLLTGDLAFFDAGMAYRAHMTVDKARVLLHQRGRDGFLRIYRRTEFPSDLAQGFWICLLELDSAHGRHVAADEMRGRMTSRLMDIYDQLTPGDVDELVAQVTRLFGGKDAMLWR